MSAKSVSTASEFFKTLSKFAADNAPSNKELKTKKAEKEKEQRHMLRRERLN